MHTWQLPQPDAMHVPLVRTRALDQDYVLHAQPGNQRVVRDLQVHHSVIFVHQVIMAAVVHRVLWVHIKTRPERKHALCVGRRQAPDHHGHYKLMEMEFLIVKK